MIDRSLTNAQFKCGFLFVFAVEHCRYYSRIFCNFVLWKQKLKNGMTFTTVHVFCLFCLLSCSMQPKTSPVYSPCVPPLLSLVSGLLLSLKALIAFSSTIHFIFTGIQETPLIITILTCNSIFRCLSKDLNTCSRKCSSVNPVADRKLNFPIQQEVSDSSHNGVRETNKKPFLKNVF